MTCVTIYVSGFVTGRYQNIRTWVLPVFCWPMIIGACMIWKGNWAHKAVPLIGYYLVASFGAPYVIILALAAANVAGGTKKAIATGMIFIGYNGKCIFSFLFIRLIVVSSSWKYHRRIQYVPHIFYSHFLTLLFTVVLTPEKAIHYRSTWIAIIVCMCCTYYALLTNSYS